MERVAQDHLVKRKKTFFFKNSELSWLNELGKKGYRLVSKKDSTYSFAVDPDSVWYYGIEWMDCSSECAEYRERRNALSKDGVEFVLASSLWGYFISDRPIVMTESAKKKLIVHYRNISIFLYICAFLTACLIGYHFYIRDFLIKQKLFLTAPARKAPVNFFVDFFNRIGHGAKVILYKYASLFTGIFGNTKATTVLCVLIPMAILFAVFGALLHSEWLNACAIEAKADPCDHQNTEGQDEESEISGEAQ